MSSSSTVLPSLRSRAQKHIADINQIFTDAVELEFFTPLQLLTYAMQERVGSIQKQNLLATHQKSLKMQSQDLEKLYEQLFLLTVNPDMAFKYQMERVMGLAYLMQGDITAAVPYIQRAANHAILNVPKEGKIAKADKDLCVLVARIREYQHVPKEARFYYEKASMSGHKDSTFQENEVLLGMIRTLLKTEPLTTDSYKKIKKLCTKVITFCDMDFAHEQEIDNELKQEHQTIQKIEKTGATSTTAAVKMLKMATATFHVKDETMILIEKQKKEAEAALVAARLRKPAKKEKAVVKDLSGKLGGKIFLTSAGGAGSQQGRGQVTGVPVKQSSVAVKK